MMPGTRERPAMNQQLQRVIDEYDSAQERLHRCAETLPEARWAIRNHPDRWSVAECVGHLNITSRAYLPRMSAALEEARRLTATPGVRYRRDAAGWLMYFVAGPLPGLGRLTFGRIRTPPSFVPTGELPRSAVLAEFDQLQREQIAIVRQADGVPIDRVQIVSPFDPRLHYNLYSTLSILPRHEIRHIIQAERVWI